MRQSDWTLRQLRTHLPFGLVLLLVVAGLIRIVQYHWREGTVLIGLALLLAAGLRALLVDQRAGLLAVRGRPVDVLSYAALATCMLFVAVTLHN